MSVFETVTPLINRFGEDIELECGGKVTYSKAIIQPMLYKNKMYLGGDITDAGWFDGGHYQMIAPSDIAITDYRNTIVSSRGSRFTIKRSEVVSADNTDLYIWAVLTPYTPPVEDDYDDTY